MALAWIRTGRILEEIAISLLTPTGQVFYSRMDFWDITPSCVEVSGIVKLTFSMIYLGIKH